MDIATSRDLVEGMSSRLVSGLDAVLIRAKATSLDDLTSTLYSSELICSGECRRPFGMVPPPGETDGECRVAGGLG